MTFQDNPVLGKFNGQPPLREYVATREELKACYERIARLEADLLECQTYLEKDMDVIDGDNGEHRPNQAMRLCQMIDETLHGPGGF